MTPGNWHPYFLFCHCVSAFLEFIADFRIHFLSLSIWLSIFIHDVVCIGWSFVFVVEQYVVVLICDS